MNYRAVVIPASIALLLGVAGCAKRPLATQASAPAPLGAAAGTGGGPVPAAGATTQRAAATTERSVAAPATATRPAITEFRAVAELKDIHFDFDKVEIRPADAAILDANAAYLKTREGDRVLIEGHCDERGTNEYNVALGERRATAVMNYLVARGVRANRLTTISYGEERPLCTQQNESCWSQNRRAHFLVKPQ